MQRVLCVHNIYTFLLSCFHRSHPPTFSTGTHWTNSKRQNVQKRNPISCFDCISLLALSYPDSIAFLVFQCIIFDLVLREQDPISDLLSLCILSPTFNNLLHYTCIALLFLFSIDLLFSHHRSSPVNGQRAPVSHICSSHVFCLPCLTKLPPAVNLPVDPPAVMFSIRMLFFHLAPFLLSCNNVFTIHTTDKLNASPRTTHFSDDYNNFFLTVGHSCVLLYDTAPYADKCTTALAPGCACDDVQSAK